jgi:mannose-6-phosphate isomerase
VRERDPIHREKLLRCDHFGVCRVTGEFPFTTGAAETCRLLVCLEGVGELEHAGIHYPFSKGDVLLLPAVVGACSCRPNGTVKLLEIALPEIVNA